MTDTVEHTHTVVVAAFDRALPSGLTGLQDFFALASMGLANAGKKAWRATVIVAGNDGGRIVDGRGHPHDTDCALAEIDQCDAVLVPGFVPDAGGRPPFESTTERTRHWMRRQHARGALLAASCSGAFALGEAALLDGRRCTTTWWLCDELQRRRPGARVAWGAAFVPESGVVTAAGPLSWVDLALHVTRSLVGAEAARIAADFAVVDTAPRSQVVYAPQGFRQRDGNDALVADAARVVRGWRGHTPGVADLAAALSVSERTLLRRLKACTGEGPKPFIDRVRMESACTMLQTTDRAVSVIAGELGYADHGVFRRRFRHYTGMTPTRYRQWCTEREAGAAVAPA